MPQNNAKDLEDVVARLAEENAVPMPGGGSERRREAQAACPNYRYMFPLEWRIFVALGMLLGADERRDDLVRRDLEGVRTTWINEMRAWFSAQPNQRWEIENEWQWLIAIHAIARALTKACVVDAAQVDDWLSIAERSARPGKATPGGALPKSRGSRS